MNGTEKLDRFLLTDPQDVGCDEAMDLPRRSTSSSAATDPAAAAKRYPGIAAHLAACGPCAEDFAGLLAAVTAAAS